MKESSNTKAHIFSFFSGAGFLDLGFETTSGYEVVYVSEYYKPFNDIYRYSRTCMNFPQPQYGHHIENVVTLLGDENQSRIGALIKQSKEEALVGFIGGPPCPDFSVAGANRGKDGDNGKLSGTYVELICVQRPDFFVFENVKGLYKTKRHRAFFEQLKDKLTQHGYMLTEQLVNALEFGVPQDRYRIILIGIHADQVRKLELASRQGELLQFPWDNYKKYTMERVMSCVWPTHTPYHSGAALEVPKKIIKDLTVQHWWSMNRVESHPNQQMFFRPKAALAIFETKDEGDVDRKCYKRLHRYRYSPTAAYGNNEVHIHPYQPRRISVAEALAIQSLPPQYEIPLNVTLTDAFKTIGNGVPYLLAKGVALALKDYLRL